MYNVAIIGAGPAGLTAGFELLKRAPEEYHVTIYEESGTVGGISRTVNHHGNRMDLGGHRFFSKEEPPMYVEAICIDALIQDADARNKTFLDILKKHG